MKTKYWKQTFSGNLNERDVNRAVASAGTPGTIVRIEAAGGSTVVYFAGEKTPAGATEVPESDVTKFG